MKVWDLHCDTLYELRRAEKAGAPKSFLHNDLHIDLEKLQQGDYLLQCFAAYVDLADPAPGADPLVSVLEEIDIFTGVKRMAFDDAVKAGLITLLGEETDKMFMANVMAMVNDRSSIAQVQRHADGGRGWLLQGQSGRAAAAAGAGRAHDDPDMEPRKRAGKPAAEPRRGAGAPDRKGPDREGL